MVVRFETKQKENGNKRGKYPVALALHEADLEASKLFKDKT